MSAPSAEALIAQIRAAWAKAVRPPDNKIATDTYDDEGLTAYFAGRSWEGHDAASLGWHWAGLSFFSAEGFSYYLPAFLLGVIEDFHVAGNVYGSILYHLSPAQLGRQWADSYRARIAAFNDEQKRALIAYLEWCRARYEDPEGGDVHDITTTIEYLATGQVPSAESAIARLLELAGQRRAAEEVTWLTLSHSTVRDADLAGLAAFRSLRELDLAGAKISDEGLARLSTLEVSTALAKLEKLDLSNGQQFSAAGLFHLNALCSLAELRLPNSELTDAKLAALDALALRALDVTHSRELTDAGWGALNVSRLELLDMYGVAATDALLARLGAAGVLRKLTCSGASAAGVVALASRPEASALVTLSIHKASGLDAAALAALAKLPALRELSLGEVDAQTWPAGFPALGELTLLSGALSAEAAAGLAELPALDQLGLFGQKPAPGALAALTRSPSLRRLSLYVDDLDDARFLELDGSGLARLTVQAPALSNAALAVLAQLPKLQELHLSHLAIDDDGLEQLAATPALRTLHLEGIALSNAGLHYLSKCRELTTLRLERTKVTSTGFAIWKRTCSLLEASLI